jgi:hypothetical protein
VPAHRPRSDPPDAQNEEFVESNLMHSIIGCVYGNMPLGSAVGEGMSVRQGEHVRSYLSGMGTRYQVLPPA